MGAGGSAADLDLAADIRAVLMPGFAGCSAPEWVLDALSEGLHAVCVYGGNVRDRAQLAALCAELRAAAPDAVIAIDEEGGEVTRLHYTEGSPYPGAAVLGRIDDLEYTERVGRRVGAQIVSAGFTLALAPDADVNGNPKNPVIGTRSFGASPDLVSRHVAAWVRGLQSTGAIACAKHFPGHGDTAQDSHLALPVVDADASVVAARDLPPFAAAIAAGARAIMTSHLLLPHLDAAQPATFSRALLQGVLRDRLGFEGAIVSDALDMRGASGETGVPEAAVRALAAGCDLLCLGTDVEHRELREIEAAIARAVSVGRIPARRVREAARRVRALTGPARAAEGDPPRSGLRGAAERLGGTVVASREPDLGPGSDEVARIAGSFSGAARARRWLLDHPGAAIVRVETEANMAVGTVPWGPFATLDLPFLADRAGAFAQRARFVVDAGTQTPWPLSAEPAAFIVIGRDLHRHAFARRGIDGMRDAGHAVLAVEMGWPEAHAGPAGGGFADAGASRYCDLACYGSTALVGAALVSLLEGSAP